VRRVGIGFAHGETLRIEFARALYPVTARGDGREAIYLRDSDRQGWLQVMAQVCERFNRVVHAYCQMGNHYHLLVETPDGNLANGIRQLNGVYSGIHTCPPIGRIGDGRKPLSLSRGRCFAGGRR
jgi:hypothetical protein